MLYVLCYFFMNNYVVVEEVFGVEVYVEIFYKVGYKFVYYWCDKEVKLYGLIGMVVFEYYLKCLL